MRYFETGATRDSDEDKLDFEGFLSPYVMYRFAEYMHKHRFQADGHMRASDNWQKGIPQEAYMKSLLRHVFDLWIRWRADCTDREAFEDALCAILFNAQGMLHERMKEDRRAIPAQDHAERGNASYSFPKSMGGAGFLEYYKKQLEGMALSSNPVRYSDDHASGGNGDLCKPREYKSIEGF